MRTLHALLIPALTATLAGCTVGPNYAGPPPASPSQGTPKAFVRAGDIPVATTEARAAWWEELNDPILNDLVARALADSPTIAVMQARLRQARASLRLEQANGAPKVNAIAAYAHARIPGTTFGSSSNNSSSSSSSDTTDLNLYNLGFDASWEIDLFGGQRRKVEAARETAETAAANVADAQVSLTADVVQAYVNLRDRQERLQLNAQSIAMQEQMLGLTQQRFDKGTASRLDVSRLRGQLENTRADSLPLSAERDAYLNALATLIGEQPGALDALLTPIAPVPLPPAAITISDPATLIQHRPDIRAAERTLAANTAKIGAAEAARFPRLSLMGIIGIGGTKISDLGKLDDFALIAAPQLSWSFLDFGRNRANVIKAKGARDEAEAQYRATVLVALRDAEDSLSRFRNGRAKVATLARAKMSIDDSVTLFIQRYRAGTSTLIDQLDAQRTQITAAQNLAVAKAQLTGDFISIQKALGLGWTSLPAQK